MRVLLDSSILCSDFYLETVAFKLLRDATQSAGFSLLIPEVVIDEVINKYREELQTSRQKILSHTKRINHLLKTELLASLNDAAIDEATDKYAGELKRLLRGYAVETLPYPDVAHRKVVQRALRRKKPFSERGTGYRDFLIWESVLHVLNSHKTLAFISANTRDFAENDTNLHADLRNDLTAREIPHDRLVYFSNLNEFVEQHIKPLLQVVSDIRTQLSNATYPYLDLNQWLSEQALTVLQSIEWEPDYIDLPIYYLEILPVSVEAVQSVEIRDVRRLSSGEIFVVFDAELICRFEYSRRKAADPAPPDNYAGPWWERIPGEDYIREGQLLRSGVGVQLVFDPEKKQVVSADVVSWFG